jgi:hypothetical protein
MDLNRLNGLETIDPRPLPPWRVDAFAEIQIEPGREIARERAETVRFTSGVIVYSDASGGEDHLGAAVVALDENQEAMDSVSIQVRPMDRWSVHVAELVGIFCAINMVFRLAHQCSSDAHGGPMTATILNQEFWTESVRSLTLYSEANGG